MLKVEICEDCEEQIEAAGILVYHLFKKVISCYCDLECAVIIRHVPDCPGQVAFRYLEVNNYIVSTEIETLEEGYEYYGCIPKHVIKEDDKFYFCKNPNHDVKYEF